MWNLKLISSLAGGASGGFGFSQRSPISRGWVHIRAKSGISAVASSEDILRNPRRGGGGSARTLAGIEPCLPGGWFPSSGKTRFLIKPLWAGDSLDLDLRALDHLAPLGRVRLDHGRELFRRAADGDEAHVVQARRHVRQAHDARDLGRQFPDGIGGRGCGQRGGDWTLFLWTGWFPSAPKKQGLG